MPYAHELCSHMLGVVGVYSSWMRSAGDAVEGLYGYS